MKRRQFTAMLATATLSLGSVAGAAADASAQETDSLQVEDVSVDLGGTTASVGEAALTYEESTMEFAANDWTMESEEGSLSIASASVVAEDVSEDTYATVRSGMAEAFEGRSASPLLDAAAEADVDPESSVQVVAESVEFDDQLIADRVEATGTAGSVVPDGTRDLVDEGASVAQLAALGTSEWSQLTVERGDSELVAEDVTMERRGVSLAVSAPTGEATVSGRSFTLEEVALTVSPPETIPSPHVEFASEVRQLAGEDDLTASALRSAAEESGVTASNTAEAVREARFELSLGRVMEGGETAVTDFTTSGTLAELVAVLRQQV